MQTLFLSKSVTSYNFSNFHSENVDEDEIFEWRDILQFFSEETKDYEYVKSPIMI